MSDPLMHEVCEDVVNTAFIPEGPESEPKIDLRKKRSLPPQHADFEVSNEELIKANMIFDSFFKNK